jgi:general secretion pathway protein G
MHNERGFSFIEVMVVVIILGVLAAVVLPRFTGRTEDARISAAVAQIAIFQTALDSYELDSGIFPTTDQGLPALVELTVIPPIPTGWKGPYLQRRVPLDPWQNPYVYRHPGQQPSVPYDLLSTGPDGQEGTEDDLTGW